MSDPRLAPPRDLFAMPGVRLASGPSGVPGQYFGSLFSRLASNAGIVSGSHDQARARPSIADPPRNTLNRQADDRLSAVQILRLHEQDPPPTHDLPLCFCTHDDDPASQEPLWVQAEGETDDDDEEPSYPPLLTVGSSRVPDADDVVEPEDEDVLHDENGNEDEDDDHDFFETADHSARAYNIDIATALVNAFAEAQTSFITEHDCVQFTRMLIRRLESDCPEQHLEAECLRSLLADRVLAVMRAREEEREERRDFWSRVTSERE